MGQQPPLAPGSGRLGGRGKRGVRMKITIRYRAQVRLAAGVPSEEVELAQTYSMREFIARLAERHGDPLRQLLLDTGGNLHPTILLFVGDEQVEPADRVEWKDGDVVTVLSPMAGG